MPLFSHSCHPACPEVRRERSRGISLRLPARLSTARLPANLNGGRVYQKPVETRTRGTQLFLAQKKQVGLPAGAGVDDRREIARKIVGVASCQKRKGEGELQRHLRGTGEFAVVPGLAKNRDVGARRNRVEKRLAVVRQGDAESDHAREQRGAFFIGERKLGNA